MNDQETTNTSMNTILVFGSNLQGIHGKGAALVARKTYGARLGVGEGPTGSAYALPTKETPYKSRKLGEIRRSVEKFVHYATEHPEKQFILTKIGCGYAGFTEDQIKPMFQFCPPNVLKPEGW